MKAAHCSEVVVDTTVDREGFLPAGGGCLMVVQTQLSTSEAIEIVGGGDDVTVRPCGCYTLGEDVKSANVISLVNCHEANLPSSGTKSDSVGGIFEKSRRLHVDLGRSCKLP